MLFIVLAPGVNLLYTQLFLYAATPVIINTRYVNEAGKVQVWVNLTTSLLFNVVLTL